MAVLAEISLPVIAYDAAGGLVPDPGPITWASSDPSVATVDATGRVTGRGLSGSTRVSATTGQATATAQITVVAAAVRISPALDAIAVGQTAQLTATAFDATGASLAGGAVTWSVSPPGAATISISGLITGVSPGAITVAALLDGTQGTLSSGVTSIYDGAWSGAGVNSNGAPQPLSFTIRYGVVGALKLTNIPTNCGPAVTGQLSVPLSVAVAVDRFTFIVPTAQIDGTPRTLAETTVTGVFDSPTSVSGAYPSLRLPAISCPDGGANGSPAAASTYTATR